MVYMIKKDVKVYHKDELQQTTYVIQKLIGKLLNHTDMWIIVNLHKKYGLDYSDIEMIFKHCIERGNRNISYIEKVAIAFAEKGEQALDITNDLALNKIQKGVQPKRRRRDDKKSTKATMPYLPFQEELTDEEIVISKQLRNVELRVQVKNEVEKDAMVEVLKESFDIHEIGSIFEHIEGSRIIKFFNVFVTKKT